MENTHSRLTTNAGLLFSEVVFVIFIAVCNWFSAQVTRITPGKYAYQLPVLIGQSVVHNGNIYPNTNPFIKVSLFNWDLPGLFLLKISVLKKAPVRNIFISLCERTIPIHAP